MYSITENPQFILCACGDAIKVDYIKKIYVWIQGFGPGRNYQVRADLDGGAKGDEPVIIDMFKNLDDAKNFIANLVND